MFSWFDGVHHVAKFQVIVDCTIGFSISVYGWFIPDDHPMYTEHKRSERFIRAFPLLSDVLKYKICTNLDVIEETDITDPVSGKARFMRHSVQAAADN